MTWKLMFPTYSMMYFSSCELAHQNTSAAAPAPRSHFRSHCGPSPHLAKKLLVSHAMAMIHRDESLCGTWVRAVSQVLLISPSSLLAHRKVNQILLECFSTGVSWPKSRRSGFDWVIGTPFCRPFFKKGKGWPFILQDTKFNNFHDIFTRLDRNWNFVE